MDGCVAFNLAICYVLDDNKVKIPIREPDYAVSTGACAHNKVIYTTENNLDVLNHDFHKGSLTPSVELDVSIPESRHGSWHLGEIF